MYYTVLLSSFFPTQDIQSTLQKRILNPLSFLFGHKQAGRLSCLDRRRRPGCWRADDHRDSAPLSGFTQLAMFGASFTQFVFTSFTDFAIFAGLQNPTLLELIARAEVFLALLIVPSEAVLGRCQTVPVGLLSSCTQQSNGANGRNHLRWLSETSFHQSRGAKRQFQSVMKSTCACADLKATSSYGAV